MGKMGAMDQAADEINKKRESRGDHSGQIQRLVRLARLHLVSRENSRPRGDLDD